MKKSYSAARGIVAVMAVLIFSVPGYAAGEDTAPEAMQRISYNDYMSIILKKLPELRKNKLQVDRAENTRYAAGSITDTNLEGSGTYSKNTQYSTNPYAGSGSTRNYSANLGLSRRIIQSGTTLNAGIGYSQNQYDMQVSGYRVNDTYRPSYYVGFSQSVLKNAFGVVDRFSGNDAEMKLAIEKLQQQENDKTSLNTYRKLYFTWIEYSETLSLLKESIRNAQVLYNQVRRKFRTGLSDNDDVQNAADTVLQYRISYQNTLSAFNTVQKQLQIFFDAAKYRPDAGEFERYYSLSGGEKYEPVPFEKTRNAEIYRLTKKNYAYSQTIAENKLLPDLNIIGQYTRLSQDDRFSDAVKAMNDSDYYIGFTVTYPIGNTESRSSLRESELAVMEVNHEFDITRNEFRKSLQSIIQNTSGLKKMISLTEQRIRVLESKYRTEQGKYHQARLDLNYLITTANNITSSKVSLLSYKNQMIQNHIDYGDLVQ
ncbi:MAG TPA: TolC family protein [Spirochaetota bacterium]|nr:TolC family protein [Spirochaetota bacterium]HPQ52035.1 TolC family protein [Spirochaetota bacterium]